MAPSERASQALRRTGRRNPHNRLETPTWARALAWAASVLLILWWTLMPFTGDASPEALSRAVSDIQWIPFVERGRPPLWSDVFANLGLFLPFGFTGWRLMYGRRGRLGKVLAAALVLSLIVEALQLFLPARRTTATDVVVDGLGALLGVGVGRLWETCVREVVWEWGEALARGETVHALFALWAVCLAVWALLPGTVQTGTLWSQTQGFTSSFRRFPGWWSWITSSGHLILLGAICAALVARTERAAKPLQRAAVGLGAAVLLGLGLESLQLLAPSRRADIFQALAFGAGGIPGSLLGLGGRFTAIVAAGVAIALGVVLVPSAGLPVGETQAVLLLGAAFLVAGTLPFASGPEEPRGPPRAPRTATSR
ncbi:MAG: VanZ family protein [Deferrisomatales bacterium]|nr:VanZ family protein [Deferrisomatales bacterium]